MNAHRLSIAALLLATWALALAWRWPVAAELNLGSDGIGQWSAALSVLRGGWPRPPNPEGGHSLWLFGLPPVLVGRSLLGAAQVRVVMAALIAPLGAASALLLSPVRGRLAAGALAGSLLAVDPGLVDTLHIAFRGYGAPELVALAGLGLAAGLRGWLLGPALATAALGAASGQHPMAGGALVAGVLVLLLLRRQLPPRCLPLAFAALAVVGLPRLTWLWQLGQCGAGLLACIGGVASGSSETGLSAGAFVQRAFHDRFLVDFPGTLPTLALALAGLGAAAAPAEKSHARAALAWALLATGGVVLLGLGVSSLRPYHLRIVAAPLAVAVALGASRLWPLAAVLALVLPLGLPRAPVPPGDGGPRGVDALAQSLSPTVEQGDPVRIDAVWFGDPVGLEPAPLALSLVLQGLDPERLQATHQARCLLMVNTEAHRPAPPFPPLARWTEGYALAFPDLAHARRWVEAQQPAPVVQGGAADWVGALHPGDPRQDAVSW